MEVQAVFKDFAIDFNQNNRVNIQKPQTDALVIRAEIGGYNVERVFVDTGSSVDVMVMSFFEKMNSQVKVKPVGTSLFGFAGESVRTTGK